MSPKSAGVVGCASIRRMWMSLLYVKDMQLQVASQQPAAGNADALTT
jgi:hypothetical protein